MNDGLKDKYKREIIGIISKCDKVKKIVLFGSRALGTFRDSSDIDLVLYGENLTFKEQAKFLEEIEHLTVPQFVDLVLYHTIKSKELVNHIKNDGVSWWVRDA